ncbi:N-acetylmannosamine-6-phosphate 2-epimerase [Paenibacillus sp. p3-SID1389]|uniref:N-acetylmannosamine-6-phosphate 2-epimerase n=1 Tax=Paenibacillus sp. p3-SID1389 TaxID=2916364 RepID=UPI0021A5EAF7|nr:N-acetylmannosamine-6-phosphate 2-epimerase [Paenibacillus sp. p3-SID1389]MCT2195556.1 N-acetylmannosamine-6-phosphate 2-epimerase [Paenibacillus sp. p3-SID1389]
MSHPIVNSFKGGLIVSCQALECEPFFGSEYMARFALSAEIGRAVGIRANTPADIEAIKRVSKLPLIGLWKRNYADSSVYITPTLKEVDAVISAGADIVALDATSRQRPGGVTLAELVHEIRARSKILLMADVSNVQEGLMAEQLGFDLISTTLSGYTSYSPQRTDPDYQLIADLSRQATIPVLAEGRVRSPEQALRCLNEGAFAVVVGGAITRPQLITRNFAEALSEFKDNKTDVEK